MSEHSNVETAIKDRSKFNPLNKTYIRAECFFNKIILLVVNHFLVKNKKTIQIWSFYF